MAATTPESGCGAVNSSEQTRSILGAANEPLPPHATVTPFFAASGPSVFTMLSSGSSTNVDVLASLE